MSTVTQHVLHSCNHPIFTSLIIFSLNCALHLTLSCHHFLPSITHSFPFPHTAGRNRDKYIIDRMCLVIISGNDGNTSSCYLSLTLPFPPAMFPPLLTASYIYLSRLISPLTPCSACLSRYYIPEVSTGTCK